jgi:hypothetical protein
MGEVVQLADFSRMRKSNLSEIVAEARTTNTDLEVLRKIEEKLTLAFFEDEQVQEYATECTISELKSLQNENGGTVYDEINGLSVEARLAVFSTFDTNHLVRVFMKAVLSKLTV